jgi:hypothetical protein
MHCCSGWPFPPSLAACLPASLLQCVLVPQGSGERERAVSTYCSHLFSISRLFLALLASLRSRSARSVSLCLKESSAACNFCF